MVYGEHKQMIKSQTVLPANAVVRRIPAGPAVKGSPFWRRSIRVPKPVASPVQVLKHGNECDDCGRRNNLKFMGVDEMGKMYLCQTCIDTNGPEYLTE